MNRVLCYIFAAFAIYLQCCEGNSAKKEQVKITGVNVHYLNQNYSKELKWTISKKNDTYNNLELSWIVSKDLPSGLRLITTVYITDSNHENAKVLLTDDTPVCRKSKNWELLPLVLTSIPNLGGQCVKKGVYTTKDMGQFRFEVLVPNIDKKGKYYKVDYRLVSPGETLLFSTFDSQWGLLKNQEE